MHDNAEKGIQGLLRAARPFRPLPPGFRTAVWRRIDRPEASDDQLAIGWRRMLSDFSWRPRWVLGGVACALIAGASLGISDGRRLAHDTLRQRYVETIAPDAIR